MFDDTHRQDALRYLMELDYEQDIYGELAVFHILQGEHVEKAMQSLQFTADWFEHPHPQGRDLRGESDFAAIRMLCALYEPDCYDRLTDAVKLSLKRFYLERDFSSIYGSENHALMFHASRFLAAQFYQGEYFACYSISAEECYEKELAYLHAFLDFRAGRGWGEFDSLGYAMEIMIILCTLHKYAKNQGLKNKCHMAMDVILLDMMADSLGELYGGAHGRSYPQAVLNRQQAPMVRLYRYYFGGRFYDGREMGSVNIYLSDYIPSPVLYEIAADKKLPYENRERKHLHCMSAWTGDIAWDTLEKEQGSINKYTYVCEDYCIGSVNRQDDYSEETNEWDRGYARHQQHEWELTLPGGDGHLIFTHHYAIPDYHKINNRWTGDHSCCCGSYYTNQNTAIAMYNIDNQKQLPLINAYVDLELFEEKLLEEKYLFLAYQKLYISLYFDNGYRINHEDEFAEKELLSDGWQNAVVCRVEYRDGYASLEEFAAHIKGIPVVFDRQKRRVAFDGIEIWSGGNRENGVDNAYPYEKVYDCPFLQSVWDSKVVEVIYKDKKVVYDFPNNCIR